MKRLIVVCLGLMILLVACGNKVDGTYKNEELTLRADDDAETAQINYDTGDDELNEWMEEEEEDLNYKGEIDKKKKTMTFKDKKGNVEMKMSYKVKGKKLILKDKSGSSGDEKIVLKKQEK
ncbi:hypothetical protein WL511_05285 [Staphylococcus pettenkoferi]|uniref:hypothetical protein n=1 Tax=Staphylococcus pettenkoferi TaxID=170573 RepID=UPI0030BA543B